MTFKRLSNVKLNFPQVASKIKVGLAEVDSDEEEEGYRIYLNENCQNEYFGEDDDDYLGAESYED